MDYSKFTEDEFDSKEWINSAFKSQNRDANLEQYASTVVMKLQMLMQEVNNVVDEGCQQVINNLPRVSKELEAVKQEAVLLQQQMKMVKYDIQKVEHDTANSMQTLLQLDNVKVNMKAASNALKEADNWTSLSSDVDDVFESQDIPNIAKKIVGMQQSLHILTDVPDYAERCQYLELLKNRLEATSSPAIVAAFTKLDLEAAQKLAAMFEDIGRSEQLCKYYHKCHKAKVVECWKEVSDNANKEEDADEDGDDDEDDNDAVTSLKKTQKMLHVFYDRLVGIILDQVKWTSEVFSAPLTTVFDMICDSFKSLHPSPFNLIHQSILSSSPSSSCIPVVDSLISIKTTTDHFVSLLQRSFTDQQLNDCSKDSIENLLMAFYKPLQSPTTQLPSLIQTHLTHHLDSIRLDHTDLMEATSLLQHSIKHTFTVLSQWRSRCVQLSGGVAYVTLLLVIKDHLLKYLQEVNRAVNLIFLKCKPLPSTTSSTPTTSTTPINSFSLDTDEWTHFQNSLRLILFSGELVSNLENLTSAIADDISTISLPDNHSNSSNRYMLQHASLYQLATPDDKKQLCQLIEAVKQDEGRSLLADVRKEVSELCACVHLKSFEIVFNPLTFHFNSLLSLPVWSSDVVGASLASDLPIFSFVPQEYITNVGEYLMTLPQQLDPFSNEDNSTMRSSLLHGNLPYLNAIVPDDTEHLADVWLRALANGCMHQMVECVLKIPQLTHPATKQLLVDINYLVNVLEDLGLSVSEDLEAVKRLLMVAEGDYVSEGDSCPHNFVTTIAKMRGIATNNNVHA